MRGFFRRRRDIVEFILLAFSLLSPWITLNGEQALLLDVLKREFHFFGLSLYSHDAPLLFFVLVIVVFGIIFVTVVWGRVFCGWVCPQTVFIDGVFRRIEIWVEGGYLERRRMAKGSFTRTILRKKITKWFLYFVVSSIFAHSFVAVFVGSKTLLAMMQLDPRNNWTYFSLISAFTLLILFNFGWFREQFCLIVCPYGRFQSVLLGAKTLTITYDIKRGEPRKSKNTPSELTGDCVNCRRCVEVCPTGIDIRNGLQMECIACTACADACDEIMDKVKKPRGLIRYMTSEGKSIWTLRAPRAIFSLSAVLMACGFLIANVWTRDHIDVTVLRGKDALFQRVEENGVHYLTNHYRLHIKNQAGKELSLNIAGSTADGALQVVTPFNPLPLKSNEAREIHIFLKFPESILTGGEIPAQIVISDGVAIVIKRSVHLVGPGVAK